MFGGDGVLVILKSRTETKEQMNAFFHITATTDVASILKDGLRGSTNPRNRGGKVRVKSIFVLTSCSRNLIDNVAINQVWVHEDIGSYAVIQIDPAGISGKIKSDHVAEATAPWHRIIEQQVIAPQYLSRKLIRRLNFPGRTIQDMINPAKFHVWTPEEWEIAERFLDPLVLAFQRHQESSAKKPKRKSK